MSSLTQLIPWAKGMYKFLALFLTLLLAACDTGIKEKEHHYHIGVSQCSSGHWRDKQNSEMQRELLLHEGITMDIVCADDDDDKQIQQIQQFIDDKVDLLIISPNMEKPLTDIVAKAYDSGIPVVLFDRSVEGNKYTAFVGGDNVGVGQQLALFAERSLPHGGNVIELMGNMKTSPARQRHQGFIGELRQHPEIKVLASVDAHWDGPVAAEVIDSLLAIHHDVDVIVAHSDWMASSALERVKKIMPENDIRFVGADGFGSPGLGVYAVEAGNIDATAVYPTGGDIIMQTAIAILEGENYNHTTLLPSYLVSNPKEAGVLVTMFKELEHEVNTILRLRDRIVLYVQQIYLERTVLITAIIILLLIICLLLTYIRMRIMVKRKEQQITQQKQELVQKDAAIQKKEEVIQEKEEVIMLKDEEITDIKERLQIFSEFDREFMDKMNSTVELQMSNPDFSVEMLSQEMCLSRAQMYRKCKALTGVTPVELIRNTRMERARQLFQAGCTSVTDVSTQVGIVDPSYFTRCYKTHFGVVPRDDIKGGKN